MNNPFMDRISKRATGSHGRASERRLGKEMGVRLTPASGALQGAKGDGTKGRYRIEMKSTKHISFIFKMEWLRKIAYEAIGYNQIPAVIFSFVDEAGKPQLQLNAEWIAIPRWHFEELVEAKRHWARGDEP